MNNYDFLDNGFLANIHQCHTSGNLRYYNSNTASYLTSGFQYSGMSMSIEWTFKLPDSSYNPLT